MAWPGKEATQLFKRPTSRQTMGKIVFEWDVTDPFSFDLIESESPGTMIDVCAMLAN